MHSVLSMLVCSFRQSFENNLQVESCLDLQSHVIAGLSRYEEDILHMKLRDKFFFFFVS